MKKVREYMVFGENKKFSFDWNVGLQWRPGGRGQVRKMLLDKVH